jgi:chemotaxis protein MotB
MADDKPVIIIKKKGGHGGHHGGAWKVAYADFVTAMMAFFMVMWLLNSAETKTRTAIASYFRRPGLFESGSGTPLLIGGAGILTDAYSPPKPYEEIAQLSGVESAPDSAKGTDGTGKGPFVAEKSDKELNAKGIVLNEQETQGIEVKTQLEGGAAEFVKKMKMLQKKKMDELAGEIKETLKEMPEFKELLGMIEVTVAADGLTIEIMDTDTASMFRSGSAQIVPESIPAFEKIASMLKNLPNQIEIMGHTDAKPFLSRGGMSNWELSSDRANTARRLLEQQGIPKERITSVVGRADRELRYPEDPFKQSNRRISLKVKFDMEKINQSKELKEQVLKEFGEYLPQVTPPAETTMESETSETASTESTQITEPSATARIESTAKPRATAQQVYAPKVEIRGKEAKRGIVLPPETASGATNKRAEPTIFTNDPVLGPSPIFGY